jgi:predicted DsbA family dithiol-disulfide isomerase
VYHACQPQVTWHPFQLNPALPQDDPGRNKLAYYKEKFGDVRTQQMVPRMTVRRRCSPHSLLGSLHTTHPVG